MSFDYRASAVIAARVNEDFVKTLLIKASLLGARFYDCAEASNVREIPDFKDAVISFLAEKDLELNYIFLVVNGSGLYLACEEISCSRIEITLWDFSTPWKRDFLYIGEGIDVARYSRLLFELIEGYLLDSCMLGNADASPIPSFAGRVEAGLPIIEAHVLSNPDMLFETLASMLTSGVTHQFNYMDNSSNCDALARSLSRQIISTAETSLRVRIQSKTATLLFKREEGILIVALIPQVQGEASTAFNASFYLEAALGLSENFALYSLCAEGFLH